MINEYILTKNTNIKDKVTKRLLMIAYRVQNNMMLTPNQVNDWNNHKSEQETIIKMLNRL